MKNGLPARAVSGHLDYIVKEISNDVRNFSVLLETKEAELRAWKVEA